MSGRRVAVAVIGFLLCAGLSMTAQQNAMWVDPSAHAVSFVTVDKDVRLEVLDWGGQGRDLVLLAGGGDTAHVFDDFAPKLRADFHVYGITRRGFGQSTFAAPTNGADTYGDDVLAILDALKVRQAILLGHSIAGQELSSVAMRHPNRVAALVYLEAGYPYAFDNGTGPSMQDFQGSGVPAPQPPSPTVTDRASFTALREYYVRVLGFTYPEAELRQQRPVNPDGTVGRPRDFPGYATLMTGMKKYASISVPALVLFGLPHGLGRAIDTSTDVQVHEQARAYNAMLTPVTERQAKLIETVGPRVQVVRLPGANHYIYLSNEAEVLREIRAFLAPVR